MSGHVTPEVLRRRMNAGFIAVFFAFLWLPVADSFLHLDRTPSANENRPPAVFPKFTPSLAAMHDFVSGIEAYFSDHFGFRRRLVSWGHHWKWQWFRTSKSNDVFVGKAGWLYFSGSLMIDDTMGNRPFSERELEAWRDLLIGRRDWLAQRDIRYLLVIPPDKHTIYPEHLPDWLAAASRPPHRLDQFMQYMKAHCDVPILDLRQTLFDGKKDARVFMQTDTHWNELGAFLGCRRIVEQAAALGLDVKPPDLSEFQIVTSDGPSGDLAMMLGRSNTMIEQSMVSVIPKPPLTPLKISDASDLLPKKWVFGVEPRLSENPSAKAKAIVFRDSFTINLSHFLGYSFGRIIYVWQQNWDKRIIESEKPDIVMDEMLERFLISRDAELLRQKDEEPGAQVFGDR